MQFMLNIYLLRTCDDDPSIFIFLLQHDVDSGFPDVFSNFIHVARLLSYSAISDLYKRAPTICSNGK